MTGSVLSVSKQKFVRPAELLMVGPFNKDRTKPFLFPAVSMNSRSSAQHAFMSLHTLEETKNGTLSQLPSATFQVTPEEKPSVIEALRLLGITEELIFSDINTAADSFKRKQLS